MKPTVFSLLSIAAGLLFSISASADSGWIDLFDGESTDAWRVYQGAVFPSDAWEIREGILTSIGDGERIDIVTREEFSDFELELEWRVEPRGNSGIFFRIDEELKAIWHAAPEYQILDDGPQTAPTHTTGSLYDLLPPNNKKKMRPVGEFNKTRIVASGDQFEHWLNGEKILSYDLDDPELKKRIKESKFGIYPEFAQTKTGPIGLQHHGDTVGFRNIRIRKTSSANEK